MNTLLKVSIGVLFWLGLHGYALGNEGESVQEVVGHEPTATANVLDGDELKLAETTQLARTKVSAAAEAAVTAAKDAADAPANTATDLSLNFAPAILFLFYPDDKVSRAIVRDGVVRVTKSTDAEIRIGVEAHVTLGWNWIWKESGRRSTRVGLGPFVALIFNGDSIPIGGYGVLGSLTKWNDEESATPMGLNIGWGCVPYGSHPILITNLEPIVVPLKTNNKITNPKYPK